ncbi:hypothetical protein TorRG33x02_225790 [Trema orientale]|uniref:Uncharacterized protein n=1 Tax=Trema orientale TaxID=63057 RepID=A0A2P5E7W0_TREOI|nr:hypothetical protein TorRG33x02_225790 [Trema orientale]
MSAKGYNAIMVAASLTEPPKDANPKKARDTVGSDQLSDFICLRGLGPTLGLRIAFTALGQPYNFGLPSWPQASFRTLVFKVVCSRPRDLGDLVSALLIRAKSPDASVLNFFSSGDRLYIEIDVQSVHYDLRVNTRHIIMLGPLFGYKIQPDVNFSLRALWI